MLWTGISSEHANNLHSVVVVGVRITAINLEALKSIKLKPDPSTGPKLFWVGPKCFGQIRKNIYNLCQSQTFCATPKDDFHSINLVSVPAQKFLKRPLNTIKFLDWLKKFGPAQNILGLVEGQGIKLKLF